MKRNDDVKPKPDQTPVGRCQAVVLTPALIKVANLCAPVAKANVNQARNSPRVRVRVRVSGSARTKGWTGFGPADFPAAIRRMG